MILAHPPKASKKKPFIYMIEVTNPDWAADQPFTIQAWPGFSLLEIKAPYIFLMHSFSPPPKKLQKNPKNPNKGKKGLTMCFWFTTYHHGCSALGLLQSCNGIWSAGLSRCRPIFLQELAGTNLEIFANAFGVWSNVQWWSAWTWTCVTFVSCVLLEGIPIPGGGVPWRGASTARLNWIVAGNGSIQIEVFWPKQQTPCPPRSWDGRWQ